MQEYLTSYFFYFFESLFEFFWGTLSHTVKIYITLEFNTTPAQNTKLEYHTKRIPDSPVQDAKSITGTENPCFLTL